MEPGQSPLRFSTPKKIENAPFPNWDHKFQTIYEYQLTASFEANEEDALLIAQKRVETLASRLSFFCSVPVQIESFGSVTNAPENPTPGVTYKVIAFGSDQVSFGQNARIIDEKMINHLMRFLNLGGILKKGGERIERSMLFLHHSYFASSPIDEFMYLTLSFEAISQLLKTNEPYYWHCKKCETDITNCPHCGTSTEWSGSGNLHMQSFVCNKLNWKKQDWTELWDLRNKVFHGSRDISFEQQQNIIKHLIPLEKATLSAIGYILSGKKDIPKVPLRNRGMFKGAELHVEYHVPSKER